MIFDERPFRADMLRVVRLSDRTGRYYLADRADELDAVLAYGERARWVGDGAQGLGLVGRPDGPALQDALSGRHPATGRALVRRLGSVSGYDLTFAAPKSASAVFALGTPEQSGAVVRAHHAAVDAALGYVARRAAVVWRAAGEDREMLPVDGLVAAAFTHGVSRAQDPHLHSHAVVANLGHGSDSRWSALDGRGLFAHARAAGALYDAHLRAEITSTLGAHWEQRSAGSIEIAQVSPLLVGALSRRRAEILEHAHWSSSGSSRTAARVTREEKGGMSTPAELRSRWRRSADDVGADLGSMLVRRHPGARRHPDLSTPIALDERRFAGAVDAAGDRGVTRRQVVAAWAGALTEGVHVADADACVELLADFGDRRGVAELAVGPGRVTPPGWQLRALGPRPGSPRHLAAWRAAGEAIDRYRSTWPIEDPRMALGVVGTARDLARLPARRLADHLKVSRQVDDVARLLERRPRAAVRERDLR